MNLALLLLAPLAGAASPSSPTYAADLSALRPVTRALGFLLARGLPAWREDATLTPERLRRASESYLERERRSLGLETPFAYADFLRWYERRSGLEHPPQTLSYDDVGPHGGPDPSFLQRMSLSLERTREECIVRAIEAALQGHDRVLVVYGSGHLVKQRSVWAALLGPSEDSKPF